VAGTPVDDPVEIDDYVRAQVAAGAISHPHADALPA
jgi:hypothetical protein